MEDVLKVKNLSKHYKNKTAVDNISFFIEKGTIFGLLGPNGAGKTTLLRMITGILIPDSGEVYVKGNLTDLVNNAKFIGYMPEERGLYKKMEAEEQAIYLAQLKGLPYSKAKEKVSYWFDRLNMNDWKNKKMDEISKGMGQKLQFVCTVIHEPSLIILDEPFSGLDPLNADIIKNEIFELAKKGATIIFSTHRMEQVEEICERIALMNDGKIILNDSVQNAKRQFIKNEYLLEGTGFDSIETQECLFQILEKEKNSLKIKLQDTANSKDILKHLANQDIEINKFELNTPSLNEIFIDLVSKNN